MWRTTLYKLKQLWGKPGTLERISQREANAATGAVSIVSELIRVNRLIILPYGVLRSSFTLVHQQTFPNDGGYDLTQMIALIDANDLPSGYQFTIDTYVTTPKQRFNIKSWTLNDGVYEVSLMEVDQ